MKKKPRYLRRLITSGLLPVDEVNQIKYYTFGNIKGIPLIICHGGPGGSAPFSLLDIINLKTYYVVLFDQRGCGESTPFLSTHNNDIYHLVSDIELLRTHLNIRKFIISGGSFGSTLALAYAIKHPENLLAIHLRGVFLGRQGDVDWLYEFGAGEIFPEEHELLKAYIDNGSVIPSYYELFNNSDDKDKRAKALKTFCDYEANMCRVKYNPKYTDINSMEKIVESIAYLENYYFYHKVFKEDNYILDNAEKIKNIKCYIYHGRYDVICRPSGAYQLHKKLPNSSLEFVNIAGHSSGDPMLKKALKGSFILMANNLKK